MLSNSLSPDMWRTPKLEIHMDEYRFIRPADLSELPTTSCADSFRLHHQLAVEKTLDSFSLGKYQWQCHVRREDAAGTVAAERNNHCIVVRAVVLLNIPAEREAAG
jgi:hypothetical protein